MYYNNCSSSCGCAATAIPTPYYNNANMGCGCNFQVPVTPITMPERTTCQHACSFHEQPVIIPVENRMIHHHRFTPRYYGVSRNTHEDVIEENPYMSGNFANAGIYPNFLNM